MKKLWVLVLIMLASISWAEVLPSTIPEPAEALNLFKALFASTLGLVVFVSGVVEMLKKRVGFSGWTSVAVAFGVAQVVAWLGFALGVYTTITAAVVSGFYIGFWAAGGYALVREIVKKRDDEVVFG